MRIFLMLIIFFTFQNCSFDNKSGIWKSETETILENNDELSQFKDVITANSPFKEEINIEKGFKFKLPGTVLNKNWTDIFYNQYNNTKNFKLSSLNNKSFQSKKITKYKMNNYFLYENDNIISVDLNGNINIYSLTDKKKIFNYNFYKNKYKKNLKKLNFIVEKNIIYVSDNLGYLYSLDYNSKKILWAKNFKIPFRSNLKIYENKLILSNQNNHLYYVNKNDGNIMKLIPTEETIVKNKFVNNISLDRSSTYFLNTFGSLYSIDNKTMQIKWFINLNESSNVNPSDLFLGNKLINTNDKIVVTTNFFTYIMDSNTGSILHKMNFSSFIKPLIINDYLYLVSKNNLLISFDLNTGKIIYSQDINKKISEFLNTNKKKANFRDIFMINNKIHIFLKNSFVLVFNSYGSIEKIKKLPSKLNSQPIFIKETMIFFNFNNKINIIN